MWTWSLAFMDFNSKSTSSKQQLLWEFSFAPMFIYLQKWVSSTWACLSRWGCLRFPSFRAKMVKSACFWLFVNEIAVLAVWNHLARAQHELFASNPAWHPSEVRILLWLRCLQEVLRATKNLAKITHKSIMMQKPFPQRNSYQTSRALFCGNQGVLEEITQRPRQREMICYHSPNLAWFYFSKITVCNVWVLPCWVFSPSRNNNHENLHTALEHVFVNSRGIYWRKLIADSVLTMSQGMFWACYINPLVESSQLPGEVDTISTLIFLTVKMKQRAVKLED